MFLHVPSGVADESNHVMIVERVERRPARTPHPDQPGVPKQAELMGDGRLGQPDEGGQIGDTPFAMHERIHESDAGGITEEPEHVRDGIDGPAPKEARPDFRKCLGFRPERLGVRTGWHLGGHLGRDCSHRHMNT